MKPIILIVFTTFFACHALQAQTNDSLCVELQLKTQQYGQQDIYLKEQDNFKIDVTIKNCSKVDLEFDTTINFVPNVWLNGDEDWNISFEVYKVNGSGFQYKATCNMPDIDRTYNNWFDTAAPPIFKIQAGNTFTFENI